MNSYHPKKMLVTGGAGFIGSNFIKYVNAQFPDIYLVNLDKLTYAANLKYLNHLPNPKQYHFILGDINDESLVKHILQHQRIDTIVHFAAETHVDRSIVNSRVFTETNVMGTQTLLEAALHHWFTVEEWDQQQCRFHHISTDEVYGSLELNDPAFTEKTPYAPRSPYAASKAGADHLVNAYYHTHQLPITISNCSNNYGPNQHPEKFIPTIILSCLKGLPIPVYGNGHNVRDWIYVEDHCEGIMRVIQHGKLGNHYNLGGNNEWENLSLVKTICEQLDKIRPQDKPYEILIQFIKDRPGHDFRYAINYAKASRELDWQPGTTFEQGVQKTIQFYNNNQIF